MYHLTDEQLSMLSDLTKDAYGCRRRGLQFESKREYDQFVARTVEAVREQMEYERVRQLDAQKAWEQMLTKMSVDYNIDRSTAIRWLVDSEDVNPEYTQDVEMFLFGYDLAFCVMSMYCAEVKAAVEQPM